MAGRCSTRLDAGTVADFVVRMGDDALSGLQVGQHLDLQAVVLSCLDRPQACPTVLHSKHGPAVVMTE